MNSIPNDQTPLELVSDLNVRHELLGLELQHSPYAAFVSSQRAAMLSSNLPQAMVLDGAEFPHTSTGAEPKFAKYTYDPTARPCDLQVVARIPKFRAGGGSGQIRMNPTTTIIGINHAKKTAHVFEIPSFVGHAHGFGYRMIQKNHHLTMEGAVIPKDAVLAHPTNHTDKGWALGVNANVAFMSLPEITQDAFVISQRLADKCATFATYTTSVNMHSTTVPVNLYGESDYKAFPDIDEVVPDHGILFSTRDMKDSASLCTDSTAESLSQTQYRNDKLYRAPAGAMVLDVQVYIPSKIMKKLRNDPGPYAQILKYAEQHDQYYRKVLDVYDDLKRRGYSATPALSDLIVKSSRLSVQQRSTNSRQNPILMDKREPIDFIKIEITYGYVRKVAKGFKFTGRDGAKGVVSDIWPTEYMPKDEYGITADIMISPESVFNRMNPAQWYEQAINRACNIMQLRLISGELGVGMDAYEKILEFIHDIRPTYSNWLRARTCDRIDEFLNGIRDDGIYMVIYPFTSSITPESIHAMLKKWNITGTPVTYTRTLPDGTNRTFTTKTDIAIGSKYLYCLGKLPSHQLSAIELGYVNQFRIPAKPVSKEAKKLCLHGQTPQRAGEDELSILMMCCPQETPVRLLGIASNNHKATNELAYQLLTTPAPTRFNRLSMSTEEINKQNVNVKLLASMLGVCGVDIAPHNSKPTGK